MLMSLLTASKLNDLIQDSLLIMMMMMMMMGSNRTKSRDFCEGSGCDTSSQSEP